MQDFNHLTGVSLTPENVEEVFKAMDFDGSGQIDYTGNELIWLI